MNLLICQMLDKIESEIQTNCKTNGHNIIADERNGILSLRCDTTGAQPSVYSLNVCHSIINIKYCLYLCLQNAIQANNWKEDRHRAQLERAHSYHSYINSILIYHSHHNYYSHNNNSFAICWAIVLNKSSVLINNTIYKRFWTEFQR